MKAKNLLKKAFLLLALMGGATSAWATNSTLIDGYTLADLPTSALDLNTQTMFTTDDCVDANGNIVIAPIYWSYGSSVSDDCPMREATWFTANNFSNSGDTWTAPDGSVFRGSEGWGSNYRRRLNVRKTERNYAVRFKGCEGISILGNANSQTLYLSVYNISGGEIGSFVETASISSDGKIATVDGLSSSNEYVAYIYCSSGTNSYLYEVAFLAPSSGPSIKASPTSVTLAATESSVAVNSSFTITGSNLTAGTYNLTIPSVTGLSVSPTSFTVGAEGTVSQEVTVSYSSTENVPANTVNITATVDEVDLSVAVNYSASVDTWELQTISTPKTWDFSTLSGGVQYSGDDLSVERVYANIAEITCPDGFDGTALAFTGEYPLRSGKGIAQNGTLKFNTSLPGYIVVKFSDTGTNASATAVKRYLIVNGETTEYWASREKTGDGAYDAQLNVITGAIAVPAGDVTISGTSALVYQKLEFTPTVSKTITDAGWATFCSPYALDFSDVEGLTAYIVTGTVGETTELDLTEVTSVPANTGVLLEGTAGDYTIPVAASSSTNVTANKLEGVLVNTVKDANSIYVLMNETAGVGFYKNNKSFTVGANTAYLPADFAGGGSGARSAYFFGSDITGVANVEAAAEAVQKDGKFFKNGKLVIFKNGKKYNANGQLVK